LTSRRPPSRLKLTAAEGGAPLAQFIAARGGVSLELARAAVLRGGAYLRGRRERDPERAVAKGDPVEVILRAPKAVELPRECVLHLDAQLLAVDKPAGISAQEELAGGPSLPDLCSELLARLGEPRTQALLVHRLDRGTTGVTVLARTRRAQAALLEEFRQRRARKEYRALTASAPRSDESSVDTPVEKDAARTTLRVLQRYGQGALMAAFPHTGRTHQIRIHLRELGCPLLGDTRHGGPAFLTRGDGARIDFDRPMLHALSLELRHPEGGPLALRAPLPADMEAACSWLLRS